MASTWYYYNEQGEKIQVTGGQLKGLAKAGMITPGTMVETENGKKALAKEVKGLTFITPEATPSKVAPPEPAVSAPPVESESYGLASPQKPSPFVDFALDMDSFVATLSEMPTASQAMPQNVAKPTGRSFNAGASRSVGSGAIAGQKSGVSIASLILGGFGMLAWLIPLFGFPITVAGLICGGRGLSKDGSGIAKLGLTLSIVGLVLTIINSTIGAYLGYLDHVDSSAVAIAQTEEQVVIDEFTPPVQNTARSVPSTRPSVSLAKTHKENGFSFRYPSDWEAAPSVDGNVIVVGEPDGNFAPNINVILTPPDPNTLKVTRQDLRSVYGMMFQNFTIKEFGIRKFAGKECVFVNYQGTIPNGIRVEAYQILFLHRNKNFTVTLTDSPSNFDKRRAVYDSIFDSFQFD